MAVLCQFLDETDYTIAFKALQERVCVDAVDAYYDCIWDSTILEFLIRILCFSTHVVLLTFVVERRAVSNKVLLS